MGLLKLLNNPDKNASSRITFRENKKTENYWKYVI